MALEIKFKRNVNQDGDVLLLTDITGAYDASDNTGGYGTPNLARADVNLVPYVTFGLSGNTIPVGDYIPDASTEIPVPVQGDGVYPVTVFALPTSYDYTGASLSQLQANAVSQFEFSVGHFQDLKAVRKKYSLLEEIQKDNCKDEDRYLDAIDYIDLQIFGAQVDLCNDLEPAAHSKLQNLTTYINNLRL